MAHPGYQPFANKGTLVPGQTISVNKYTVQVDRYLSQGGFAHVYLVRTPQPVYGTTHHVLKRVAVQNEAMLTEVKKEVDIMRILRGHPNIVYLIDAAWHTQPNGMYEVFILMEFCQGGGIIDMMNRRLRERLTEAEILTIFVDVCEGVAAMHNLRPPLLHRDLKVENILQSSATSYKLCDFGSAAPVAPRPPSTTAEIRALEADLNRHTTLQYRAPEMVDPYLRRPVDEKSDVWALGVLLYKLCYYTTPFEEHGPLAILNVQYRIPPYPVYSAQMNALIASMLKEHNSQRPTAFEILAQVHRLRGTKSRFSYNVPTRQPLSPTRSTNIPSALSPPGANALNDLVAYRSTSQTQVLTQANGLQARDTVLEAIAPMRRGRPGAAPSPDELDVGFGREEDEAWKAMKSNVAGGIPVRGHKSGLARTETWKPKLSGSGDPWTIGRAQAQGQTFSKPDGSDGFGDSFTAMGLASSSEAAAAAAASLRPRPSPKPLGASSPTPIHIPPRPPSATAILSSTSATTRPLAPTRTNTKPKDAFEGLAFSSSPDKPPAPTLGEAKKSMTGFVTGLAPPSSNGNGSGTGSRPSSASGLAAPAPPVGPSYSPKSHSRSPGPPPSPSAAWRQASLPPVSSQPPQRGTVPLAAPNEDLDAESRFPSLEELDRKFVSPSATAASYGDASLSSRFPPVDSIGRKGAETPPLPPRTNVASSQTSDAIRAGMDTPSKFGRAPGDGTKSQQVTGAAMREAKGLSSSQRRYAGPTASSLAKSPPPEETATRQRRPTLSRKHRSSMSIKQTPKDNLDLIGISGPSAPVEPVPSHVSRNEQRDWLTGNDEEVATPVVNTSSRTGSNAEPAYLRQAPSKRASYVQGNASFAAPQEAVSLHTTASLTQTQTSISQEPVRTGLPSRAHKPAVDTAVNAGRLTDNWSPVAPTPRWAQKDNAASSSSSGSDEGPEDVSSGKRRTKPNGRQNSVHDLVDLYGGGARVSSPLKDKFPRGSVVTDVKSKRASHFMAPPSSGLSRPSTPQSISSPRGPDPGLPRSSSPSRSILGQPQQQPSTAHATSPPPVSSSTSSGRSRPQSMFVFPAAKVNSEISSSKESTNTGLTLPGLAAPENPRSRSSSRRTSISDMVQMYESIGGRGKTQNPASSPPLAPSKPAGLKLATQNTSSSVTRTPLPGLASTDQSKSHVKAADTGTASTSSYPRSPSKSVSSVTETSSSEPSRPIPSRRATLTTADEPPTPLTPGSPEKPYQGVGKLIDQWQRKTAETEGPTPAPKRGGFVARRAGMVGGGSGR